MFAAALISAKGGATVETVTVGGSRMKPVLDVEFKMKPATLAAGDYLVNCTLHNKTSGEVLRSVHCFCFWRLHSSPHQLRSVHCFCFWRLHSSPHRTNPMGASARPRNPPTFLWSRVPRY